jgi:hypothetical protein
LHGGPVFLTNAPRSGYLEAEIGAGDPSLSRLSQPLPTRPGRVLRSGGQWNQWNPRALSDRLFGQTEVAMSFGKGALLWLLGIPLPIILLLAVFMHH